MIETPEPPRPKLHAFLTGQGWDHYQGAALIGCSGEYVRRMCLPFGDPRRCNPSGRMRRRIAEKTAGVIGEGDWDGPSPATIREPERVSA